MLTSFLFLRLTAPSIVNTTILGRPVYVYGDGDHWGGDGPSGIVFKRAAKVGTSPSPPRVRCAVANKSV